MHVSGRESDRKTRGNGENNSDRLERKISGRWCSIRCHPSPRAQAVMRRVQSFEDACWEKKRKPFGVRLFNWVVLSSDPAITHLLAKKVSRARVPVYSTSSVVYK